MDKATVNGQGVGVPPSQQLEKIKGIDYSIVSLIAQRIKLARSVGVIKQKANLPIRNFQVERQVYERIHRFAAEFELDEHYIHPIFEQVIASSINVQIEDILDSGLGTSDTKFLLVGGGGKMGKWDAWNFF